MKLNSIVGPLKLPFYYAKLLLLIAQCKCLLLLAVIRNRSRSRWVVTRPEMPSPFSALYKICHRLGYRITNNVQQANDLVVAWEDATVRRPDQALERLALSHHVLNQGCTDISKRHVARVFGEVFGYSLEVDPQTYRGLMVRKSDANAPHDGVIMTGPVDNDHPDLVYQKLVDNVVDEFVEDLRLPVFGDIIPYCLFKRMPIRDRFTNDTGHAMICEVGDLLTQKEIANVLRFCRAVGLDYGELDVLRDNKDGRIYVVDVNNTPFGPLDRHIQVRYYFDPTSWECLERMTRAFQEAFIR